MEYGESINLVCQSLRIVLLVGARRYVVGHETTYTAVRKFLYQIYPFFYLCPPGYGFEFFVGRVLEKKMRRKLTSHL